MIKIENIYYMLSYAFRVLKEDSYANIASEEFDNVADLLAAILARGIANQIKRGLGREYINQVEDLSSPHGKIDISVSIKKRTMLKKQLTCNFDAFSLDNRMNQILKTTALILITSLDVALERKKALKKVMLYFEQVNILELSTIQWSNIRYNRNNATYKMLINICYLVIEGMILTNEQGNRKMSHYIDDQKMHSLYEKFILEYYRKHFPQIKASAAHIEWNVDDGFIELLPMMKSDITLEYMHRTIIIDAKYYTHALQYNSFYNTKTMHSHNLYQIFTYVKNYDTNNTGNVCGILLYAKTDEEITPNHDYQMSGNKISVKTLDLSGDFRVIANQLNSIAAMLLI